jgi:AcrR family transcriptional regulator
MVDVMPSTQPGLRPPQQRRSRESLERVLTAGEKLLEQKGYEGFTIAEVSRKAKVSVGSVYGRFENKDALFRAIHRRMMDRMAAIAAEQAAEAEHDAALEFEGVMSRAVHALADGMERERALLRVFMLRGAVDPAIAKPGSEASQAVGRSFTEAVLAHRDEIGHPRPEIAVDVAFRMAYDVLARQVMYGPTFESELEISWPDLVDELIVAGLAYLRNGQATTAPASRKRATASRKPSRSMKG